MAKVITVGGNIGKTIFSTYLGKKLSEKHKVCIIYTNQNTPTINTLNSKIENKSLGELLSLAVINNFNILDFLIPLESKNLVGLSYKKSENIYSYPKIVERNIAELLTVLNELVDYIIVDMETNTNKIDRYFLNKSHYTFNLFSSNIKGISYYFSNAFINQPNITNVLVNADVMSLEDEIKNILKTNKIKSIPNCKELYNVFFDYDIFKNIPRKYSSILDKLILEVIYNGDVNAN